VAKRHGGRLGVAPGARYHPARRRDPEPTMTFVPRRACLPSLWLVPLLASLLALAGCSEPRQELPVNTRLGGDFALTDHHGERFQLTDLRGQVVLLFFGYTHCPDICPATLARVAQVYRNLSEAGDADAVQPLFI